MITNGIRSWRKSIRPVSWSAGLRLPTWRGREFSPRHRHLLGPHATPHEACPHRFIQYNSQVAISTVTLAELYAGAYKHSQPDRLVALIADLLQEVQILDFDSSCPERFG
jgi:hypothetical protein